MADSNNNINHHHNTSASNSLQVELSNFDNEGLHYVNELRDRLLDLMGQQQTIDDIEDRLLKLYPHSHLIAQVLIDCKVAKNDNFKTLKIKHNSTLTSSSFSGTLHNITSFAVAKVSNLVKSENEVDRYKLSIIDNIIGDVIRLAVGFVKRQRNIMITRSDIRTAMYADKDLVDIFLSDDKRHLPMNNNPIIGYLGNMKAEQAAHQLQLSKISYKDKVRKMVDAENSSIRDLKLIIKVFKAQLERLPSAKKHDVKVLFCNVEDILELSQTVLSTLEEALESVCPVVDEIPFVGLELFELAQAEEFNVYLTYALNRLSPTGTWMRSYLNIINDDTTMTSIKTAGKDFDLAVKYLLPNYLLKTIIQFFDYFRNINDLYQISKRHGNYDDQDALKNSLSIMLKTKKAIEYFLENFNETDQIETLEPNKADQISSKLEKRLDAELQHECNQPLPYMPPPEMYRFSEPDTKDNIQFEVYNQQSNSANSSTMPRYNHNNHNNSNVFGNSNSNAKFGDNFDFNTSTLPNIVNNNLNNNNTNNHNIANNNTNNNNYNSNTLTPKTPGETEPPVIRCATLIKLVERLTYHKILPNIVDSFLITYRSFISDPEELLDLLIERYNVPDPPIYMMYPDIVQNHKNMITVDDLPEVERIAYWHYLKRFRQEYSKPVKMRVINVLKSWVKNHFYDFERQPSLLDKLNVFLNDIYKNDKVMRILVKSIQKLILQKQQQQQLPSIDDQANKKAPDEALFKWLTAGASDYGRFDLMSLHPVEFARQLTLVEFDLFRAIKPSELINVRDLSIRNRSKANQSDSKNGGDKYDTSPNLSRMTRHFTLLGYWIRKCIVYMKDYEKRAAIYNRVILIMGILRDYNNFTGLCALGSAIESAPITRLPHTTKNLNGHLTKILESYRDLTADHMKKLHRQLKQCNPPCIPFVGSYQTKLLHAKEGNKTFIDEVDTSAISPTLSQFEFGSFSNSPVTPISPRLAPAPLAIQAPAGVRTPSTHHANHQNYQQHQQNQFFGANCNLARVYQQNSKMFVDGPSGGGLPLMSSPSSGNGASNVLAPPTPMPQTPGPPKMINFTKQRIRAGLVAEISNYQNLPYSFQVQAQIRRFIESIEYEVTKFLADLDAKHSSQSTPSSASASKQDFSIQAMSDRLDNYLYEQSERIEPKNSPKPPKLRLPDESKLLK